MCLYPTPAGVKAVRFQRVTRWAEIRFTDNSRTEMSWKINIHLIKTI